MKRKVKVKVETTVEIDVDLLDTFNDLKWRIKRKLGIPPKHQQLRLAYRVDDPGYEYSTVEGKCHTFSDSNLIVDWLDFFFNSWTSMESQNSNFQLKVLSRYRHDLDQSFIAHFPYARIIDWICASYLLLYESIEKVAFEDLSTCYLWIWSKYFLYLLWNT